MNYHDSIIMEKISHQEVMTKLAEKHEIIIEIIQSSAVHYVDIPVYDNIGDLLIMKGTLAFFEKYKVPIKSKAAFFNFSLSQVKAGETIIFQGGGNFGDLYKGPQQIREFCVSKLRNNRIIILPQTIHFSSEKGYQDCCSTMSLHPDLHICVRDQSSYELAKEMTKNVYLLPDMAHQLWPLKETKCSSKKTLGLLRTDDEIKLSDKPDLIDVIDWPELVGRRTSIINSVRRCMRALHVLGVDKKLVSKEMDVWISYTDTLINEAIDLFSTYEEIVTDRLHGHILSCLLQKPNQVLDNSYGKNKHYSEMWTCQSELVNRN